MNIKYFDLYYSVIKNRGDKEILNNKYEDNDVDYFNINDFDVPKHYVGKKNKEILK